MINQQKEIKKEVVNDKKRGFYTCETRNEREKIDL